MKLKKIASLMLAGVMAVSMLTACGSNAIDEQPPVDNGGDTTPAAGYSAMLEGKMSAQVTTKTVFQDDNDLNAALDYAVGNIGNDDISGDFGYGVFNGGAVRYISTTPANDPLRLVVSTMRDKLDVKADWNDTDTDTLDNIRPTDDVDSYNYYKKNNVNTLLVYVVDDGVAITNALDQIKNKIQSTMEDKLYDDSVASTEESAGRNYHYVCSVAVSNRSFEAGHDIGLNFIAVEVTRVDGNK